MTKKLRFLLLFVFFTQTILAQQAPAIQWQKIYGGSKDDRAYDIQLTPDGGYIVAGETKSNNWDVTGNNNSSNGYYSNNWIVKLTPAGTLQWQKCFGGIYFDAAKSIKPTTDGGYIVAGDIFASSPREYDYSVIKLNSNGEIQWQKALGGAADDRANSVQQTPDGGYIVAGYSNSTDGNVTGNHGKYDYWIVKLSSSGDIQWEKTLGGSSDDKANSVQLTADGGYIVAGFTGSNNFDVTGNNGFDDAWIVKLNSDGTIQWQKALGANGQDYTRSIRRTNDGGYILAGYTYSYRNDFPGFNDRPDYWIVKIDGNGTFQWQRSIGGAYTEIAHAVQPTTDGGYVIIGESNSLDGSITSNLGKTDGWLVKVNSSGAIQWQKSLGGNQNDFGHAVQQTADGGFVVAGYSDSGIGDNTNIYGGDGFWIVKLGPDILNTGEASVDSVVNVENPVKNEIIVQSKDKITSLQLYSMDGKLVKRSNNKNMLVSEISKGNYLLKIELESGKIISKKLIKE